MRRDGLLSLIIALMAVAPAAHAQLTTVEAPAAATAGLEAGVHRLVLHSDRIGRDFLVEVTPPQIPVLPGQKMPTIYALDMGLGIAGPVGRLLSNSASMRPAYIVAVGYLPGQELARNTDLVHPRFVADGQPVGGGGQAFEEVLVDEIRPFLEARFPLDPKRSYLFGHSFGGLFAAEVLADRPDAFAGYLIGSPSAWVDPTLPARLAAAAHQGRAGRQAYVAWGAVEDPRIVQSGGVVAAALAGPGSTMAVRRAPYAGANHTSYYAQLVLDAFPWLLPKPPEHHAIAFDPTLAARYAGSYRLEDGRIAKVWSKDGGLMGQLTGMPPIPLFPESRTAFFVKGFDAQVLFEPGNGPASGLTLRTGGVDARAVRVP